MYDENDEARARFVVGRVGVRDFTLELYDCPVTLDKCFVSEDDLVLDDHVLDQYGEAPSFRRDHDDAVRSFTAGEVALACAEKLIETLLIDHPTLALNLAAALSRDLVAQKSSASRPLKRKFLAHRRHQRRAHRKHKAAKRAERDDAATRGWFAWLTG